MDGSRQDTPGTLQGPPASTTTGGGLTARATGSPRHRLTAGTEEVVALSVQGVQLLWLVRYA